MSDASSAQRAMAGALNRCTGGIMCTCNGVHSPRSSLRSSPSRSRSATLGEDGAASGDSFDDDGSDDSEGESDKSVPHAFPEQEWSGLGTVRLKTCHHGRHCVLRKCWGGRNTFRRFLACPLEGHENCKYREWLDDEWPDRVQRGFKSMWKELTIWKAIEAFAHDELVELKEQTEEALKAKALMEEEKNRTKRVAEEVCGRYQCHAAFASHDKKKMFYIVYCLLGVVAVQFAVMVGLLRK